MRNRDTRLAADEQSLVAGGVVAAKIRCVARRLIAAVVILMLGLCVGHFARHAAGASAPHVETARSLPPLMLWAWERPEHLGFIDTHQVGVAYLARTVRLRGDDVMVRPRFQPLEVPRDATIVAVVHVESDYAIPPALTASQRVAAVRAIVGAAANRRVTAIQVDFDARASQREFYRALLVDVRRELPRATGLTMTALASWCLDDGWISTLPVDESVPMLFRMGADSGRIADYIGGGRDFRVTSCRQSVGIAIDEPAEPIPVGRRLYAFSPRAWTRADVAAAMQKLSH
jgi:hypothetical protein